MSRSPFNWRGLEGSSKIDEYLNGIPDLDREAIEFTPEDEDQMLPFIDANSLQLVEGRTFSSFFSQGYRLVGIIANRLFWMRLGLLSISLIFLFIFSVVFYLFLYQWAVPRYLHSIPVFLDYSQQYPTANVSISSLFRPNQRYSFSLRLYVPDSPQNSQIGNFMVDFSLFNAKGTSIFHSKRPVIPHCQLRLLEHRPICFWEAQMRKIHI